MTEKVQFVPVPTQRASEAIYEQIRTAVMRGELKPGDRLPSERAMMEMFARSRPTIREALRMLENAGLIRINPGSGGAVVTEPSSQSVELPLESMLTLNSISSSEVLEYRKLNEIAVAEWAALRRDESDLAAMRECLRLAEANLTVDSLQNIDQFFSLDIRFHYLIAVASKNRLASIVNKVIHQVVVNMLLGSYSMKTERQRQQMRKAVLNSHQRIYAAIEAGDGETARKLLAEHLVMFNEEVLLTPVGK